VFEESDSIVIDHFNYASKDLGDHSLIQAKNYQNNNNILFGQKLAKPILYRGVSHKNKDNPLVFPILRASSTSFSGKPAVKPTNGQVLGEEGVLVSALQARNNARITFFGSLDLFSDSFLDNVDCENSKFVDGLIGWTFQERGVLKLLKSEHHKANEKNPSPFYIINEKVDYSIYVQEWNGTSWIGFGSEDMQVELIMLDPHIRTQIVAESNPNPTGKHTAHLTLPDVYGVFTFKVEYNRIGYTFLRASDIVPFHPLPHDQYERFIFSAYPYYASSLTMVVGLFIFTFVFLFHKDKKKQN